jgi:hypothetical protein
VEDFEPPMIESEHEYAQYFDPTFRAWRSVRTGHRVANVDHSPVRETRTYPARYWPVEFLHRWEARQVGRQAERLRIALKSMDDALDTYQDLG